MRFFLRQWIHAHGKFPILKLYTLALSNASKTLFSDMSEIEIIPIHNAYFSLFIFPFTSLNSNVLELSVLQNDRQVEIHTPNVMYHFQLPNFSIAMHEIGSIN